MYADVAQMEEATDLNPVQCGFDSRCRYGAFVYRIGREFFTLVRRVRFPHALRGIGGAVNTSPSHGEDQGFESPMPYALMAELADALGREPSLSNQVEVRVLFGARG